MQAQNTPGKQWTLEACIAYALNHNLDVRQAELNTEQSHINYNQSKMNLLPDLNGSAGQYFQSGRNIDRFTNTAVQSTIKNNNFSLSTGVVLFAGGQLRNTVQSGKYSWLASDEDRQNIEMNVSLNVANIFLQIVQAKELVKSTQENINNTKAQLDKAQRQFDAGAINEGTIFNLKAQLANDELNLVNAQNQEITAKANLKMLLRIPVEDNFEITIPETGNFEAIEYPETVQTLYDSALAKRHDVLASEYRVESAVYRKKASFGSFLPTLTLGANLNTVYSSSAKEVSSFTLKDYTIGRVQTTNEIVISQQPVYTLATTSFSKQLKNNFGQSLGVTMSIPIFNKLQAENNYKLALIDLERNKLNAEKTKQNLYNEIVGVYNAFESAQKRFLAAKLNHDAQQLNLNFIAKRYDGGLSSATELQIAKTMENASKVNEVSVKYEYIFRRMVLDYYAGKKLDLN